MDTKTKAHYMAYACTLDGQDAVVSGRLQPFALIRQRQAPWLVAYFSWAAVARIQTAGGDFRA